MSFLKAFLAERALKKDAHFARAFLHIGVKIRSWRKHRKYTARKGIFREFL